MEKADNPSQSDLFDKQKNTSVIESTISTASPNILIIERADAKSRRKHPEHIEPLKRQGCEDRYLSVKEVAARFRVNVSTIWRWVQTAADFPQPIEFGNGTTRWSFLDLLGYENGRRMVPRVKVGNVGKKERCK